jgi:hypothetical protein
MLLQYHNLRIHLYEIALHVPLPQPENMTSSTNNQSYWRLQTLYSCLNAVKEFIDIYFTIPVELYFHLAVGAWGQITHVLIVLSRLCLLDFPNWDLNHVKEVLDFSEVLGIVGQRWAATGELLDESQRQAALVNGVFTRCSRMLRRVQHWHDARVAERTGKQIEIGETAAASGSLLSMVDEILSRVGTRQDETQYPVGFWDTEYLNDIFW